MRFWTPTMRISLGLVSLTLSLLLAANFVGLLPDQGESALEARKKVVESLAVQLSWGAGRNDVRLINTTLRSVVKRNEDILSAALRKSSGEVISQAGEHELHWKPPPDNRSTATHVQVPIFHQNQRWGTVEISFSSLTTAGNLELLKNSLIGLLLFIALVGFIVFFLFLRRALRELDPSSVIPERVRAAFDALAEGVLIMDENERIVLVNNSFAEKIGEPADSLAGRKASDLAWRVDRSGDSSDGFPWQKAIKEKLSQTGVPIMMRLGSGEVHNFMVNGSPILDGKGVPRGALATFDDVTDLERKNAELQRTLHHLEESQKSVSRQNKELHFLATRDPMTGCLNRRSFLESFEKLFVDAQGNSDPLCCIMVDIDHFKSINDRYGHSVGDKVITAVADILKTSARGEDLVCRYGGEEFCVILPGVDIDIAYDVAERHRKSMIADLGARFTEGIQVTASLGVASIKGGAQTTAELINEADMALYSAKESGRNRVIRWGDTTHNEALARAQKEVLPTRGTHRMLPTLDRVETTGIVAPEVEKLRERVTELEDQIEQESIAAHAKHGFDELTGLPNRILFHDRIEQALINARRENSVVALLYVDIDLFGRVNDTLGPVVGDNLLQTVAERMTSVLRQSDTVALIGGDKPATLSRMATDEFAVAITDVDDTESITWIVQRIFESLSQPIQIGEHEIYITASIGVSLFPNDADSAEDLIRYAGTARHHAKESIGRNNCVFYADEMNQRSYEQLRMESELRHAIEYGEMSLHFQPIWDLSTRSVNSMEALLRWRNPEMGFVSPDVFIPIAEHTGFITEIGDWVLQNACEQAKQWVDAGFEDIRVSVNLSAVQLRSENFVEHVADIIDSVGIKPRNLEFEITETALIQHIDRALVLLQELRKLGVGTAIDDFGTGYSSLGYLKQLAVDRLKIDRSFVNNIATDDNDAALVAAIIAMGHRMGMRVVAEGIEEGRQLKFLRKMRCDDVQGYLLGRPLPAGQSSELLHSVNSGPEHPGFLQEAFPANGEESDKILATAEVE